MRKFLFKIIGFASFPILCLVLIEMGIFILRPIIMSEQNLNNIFTAVSKNYSWMKKIKSNSIILLTGSSSVRYGLSCSMLNDLSKDSSNFLNLAWDARDPVETYFLIKNLDLQNVKEIYFGLDPWIYAKRYYKHRNHFLYLDFNFIEALFYNYNYDESCLKKRYISFFRYFIKGEVDRMNIHNKDVIPEDYGSLTLNENPSNFGEPIENWFQTEKYGWSKLQFEYLAKIEIFCQNKKINFAVFIPPKRSDYSQRYRYDCTAIHKEFIENLKAVNFSAPIFGSYDQLDKKGDYSLFVDPYHLNMIGQKIYSSIFFEMMKSKKGKFDKTYYWFSQK